MQIFLSHKADFESRGAWMSKCSFTSVFPFALYLCTRVRPHLLWEFLIGAGCIAECCVFRSKRHRGEKPDLLRSVFLHRRGSRPPGLEAIGETGGALLISMLCLVAVCWCAPGARQLFENAKHGATESGIYYKRVLQALLAIVTAPIALLSVRNISSRFDRTLGEFTYVFYLVHWPVMMLHAYYFESLPPLAAPGLGVGSMDRGRHCIASGIPVF